MAEQSLVITLVFQLVAYLLATLHSTLLHVHTGY